MAFKPFEELGVFQLAEKLADEVWEIVIKLKEQEINVLKDLCDELGPRLNCYLTSITQKKNGLKQSEETQNTKHKTQNT